MAALTECGHMHTAGRLLYCHDHLASKKPNLRWCMNASSANSIEVEHVVLQSTVREIRIANAAVGDGVACLLHLVGVQRLQNNLGRFQTVT